MKRYVAIGILAMAQVAWTQELNLSVFDRLKDKASDTTDVNLTRNLMQLAGGFLGGTKDADVARLKKLIDGLNGITVRSLEFDKEGAFTDADVRQLITELGAPGWNLIISADENKGKKDQEISRIWIKSGGEGEVGGLRILTAEPKELTVVVIDGKIRVQDLKDLEGLGVDLPDLKLGALKDGSGSKKHKDEE